MESTKRKHILFDRPYLGAAAASCISLLAVFFCSAVTARVADYFRLLKDETAVFLFLGIFALLALLGHSLWFRRDGYKGAFTCSRYDHRDVWLWSLAILVLDVVFFVLSAAAAVGDGPRVVLPTVRTLIMAFYAGAFEETVFRAIPISIMMKNKPDSRRMWIAAAASAAVFGLVHMSNMGSGQSAFTSAIQTSAALSLGLFFAAVYIRTGSILITMAVHSVHDLIAFLAPSQSTGVMQETSAAITDLLPQFGFFAVMIAASIYLLRKSRWEEIRAAWANIWAE